jgi:hypothetical protein
VATVRSTRSASSDELVGRFARPECDRIELAGTPVPFSLFLEHVEWAAGRFGWLCAPHPSASWTRGGWPLLLPDDTAAVTPQLPFVTLVGPTTASSPERDPLRLLMRVNGICHGGSCRRVCLAVAGARESPTSRLSSRRVAQRGLDELRPENQQVPAELRRLLIAGFDATLRSKSASS